MEMPFVRELVRRCTHSQLWLMEVNNLLPYDDSESAASQGSVLQG